MAAVFAAFFIEPQKKLVNECFITLRTDLFSLKIAILKYIF